MTDKDLISALVGRGFTAAEALAIVDGEQPKAASPVVAPVEPKARRTRKAKASTARAGFLAHTAAVKAAKIERGYVKCQQPRCTGVMHPDRSTKIAGKRACSKHFGRKAR